MSRQKLGQHFLISDEILERLACAACPEQELLVVEIGPGQGALTRHLVNHAHRVIAIELDRTLAQWLTQLYAGDPRFQLVAGDAMRIDLEQWGPAVVTGNLPYYAATAILERVVALGGTMRRGVFLTQKEVAERITATPGRRDYGYLSVAMQAYADIEFLFEVPPAAFRPPPKVDSAAIRFVPNGRAASLGVVDVPAFLRFVSFCFRQKRKTLRNNLLPHYGGQVNDWPEVNMRAEQIDMETFAAMYRRLVP